MKKIISLLILICFFENSFSQKNETVSIPTIEETKKYGFTEIIEVKGMSADILYELTKAFLTKKHSDSDFFIDKVNQEIYDNGSFPVTMKVSNMPLTYTILYNVSTKFKDSKLKVTITDFKVSTNAQGTTSEVPLENFFDNLNSVKSGKGYAKKMNDSLSSSIIEQVEKFITDLRKSLIVEEEKW
jgi:hypothetical protein